MPAIKRIKENDVNFESSRAGYSDKAFTEAMIKLAKSIVSGEYEKNQAVSAAGKSTSAKKKPATKKAGAKKAVGKKPVKKNAGKK